MIGKHFIVSPKPVNSSKEDIEKIQLEKEKVFNEGAVKQRKLNEEAINVEHDNIKHTAGRVVIKCDTNYKDNETLVNGIIIGRPRDWDNFNMREKAPTQAVVISADNIPKGSTVLIGHTTIHDTNRIFNYKEYLGSDVHYYSIPENQVFLWNDGKEWKTLFPFETALRIYEPYKGLLTGINPKLIKNTLFVTSGRLKGKAVKTVKASDYVIVFREPTTGKERQILRFRPDGNEVEQREPEAICILDDTTEKILNDEMIVGIELSDAKKWSEYVNK